MLAHSYAGVLEAETHILPLSCINSPRLMSSREGNFPPSSLKDSLPSVAAVISTHRISPAECDALKLRPFILFTSKSFDTKCNFQTKDSQGRFLRVACF